jgi:hypothetical protein
MFKRHLSSEQFIGKHPQTPEIHTEIILLPLQYLRRRIIKSATVGFTTALDPSRPAKIAQLCNAIADHNIFRFDVPMGNVHVVQVLHSCGDLPNEIDGFGFGELLVLVHIVEECAALHILQDQVHVELVAEAAVELHDRRVVHVCVQLDLLDELRHHVELLRLRLHDLLQRADEPCGNVPI